VLDPEMREPTAAICSGFPLGSIGGIMGAWPPTTRQSKRRDRLVDGRDVELWQLDRKVAGFKSYPVLGS
jgi:hypothetical protein